MNYKLIGLLVILAVITVTGEKAQVIEHEPAIDKPGRIQLKNIAAAKSTKSTKTTKILNKKESTPFSTIYNMHEHFQHAGIATKWLKAMDMAGVGKTIILGSPEATVLRGREGFAGYEKNNDEMVILSIVNSRFIPFCTIDPNSDSKLDVLKDCERKVNRKVNSAPFGLKLYSGHTMFYNTPLNKSDMNEVYKYAEDRQIPIIFHVNPARKKVQQEFEDVLGKFPKAKILCPHFCLSTKRYDRFIYLMDTYPNLYTDITFGFFVKDGMARISENASLYKRLVEKYKERVFFGTDMVATESKLKTVEWIYNLTKCYRGMLEKETFRCTVKGAMDAELNGLGLDNKTLAYIYEKGPEEFLGIT